MTAQPPKLKLLTLGFIKENLITYAIIWGLNFIILFYSYLKSTTESFHFQDNIYELFLFPAAFFLPVWTTQIIFLLYSLFSRKPVNFVSSNEAKKLSQNKKYRFFYPLINPRKLRFGVAYLPKAHEHFFLIPAFIYVIYFSAAIALGVIIYLEKKYFMTELIYEQVFTFERFLAVGSLLALLGHRFREKW